MDQLIREISMLVNGDGRRGRWGWSGRGRAWDLLSMVAALVGVAWLFRRPVPVRVKRG
jgi:hypothetical protein